MQTKLALNTVDFRNGAKGPYAYIQAQMVKKDGSTKDVVAMAFGGAFESTKRYLKAGKTVDLTAKFDGGILRILGRRAGAKAAAAAA